MGLGVGGALAVGAGVSAVAGLAGSALQSNATGAGQKAAQAQFAQEQNNLAPFRTAGGSAVGVASDLSGANGPDAANAAMANFQTDPGYQFQLQQGLRAVDAGAASQGMLRSGATLKAEDTFGQGLAEQDFTNYYNRLFGLSQLGEQAAAGGASTSIAAGNSANQAGLTQAGIYGNAAQGVGNAYDNYQNQSLYQSRTNALSPSVNQGAGGYGPAAPGLTSAPAWV